MKRNGLESNIRTTFGNDKAILIILYCKKIRYFYISLQEGTQQLGDCIVDCGSA